MRNEDLQEYGPTAVFTQSDLVRRYGYGSNNSIREHLKSRVLVPTFRTATGSPLFHFDRVLVCESRSKTLQKRLVRAGVQDGSDG